jgi:hypothetical protein
VQSALRRSHEPSGNARFDHCALDPSRRQDARTEQPATSLILLVMMRGRAAVRVPMTMIVRLNMIVRRSGQITQAQCSNIGRSRRDRSHRR